MGSNERKRRVFQRQAVVLAVLAVIVTGALSAYLVLATPRDTVDVRFVTDGEPSATLKLRVADTPGEQAKGLMFVREMGEREGMIFVFPSEEERSFWMKNTLIPLDMIFVAADNRVVSIIERAAPLTEDPRKSDGRAKYVVELNGGRAAAEGIKKGSMMELLSKLPADS